MQTDVFGKGLLLYALKVNAKTAETIKPTAAAFTPGSSLQAECTVSGHCKDADSEAARGSTFPVPAIDLEVAEYAPPVAESPITELSGCRACASHQML